MSGGISGWVEGIVNMWSAMHMYAAGQGNRLHSWWSSGGGSTVLPPLMVVVGRKNRQKCNFLFFLPVFDSSRPSMTLSSEGLIVQSLILRSHGWLLVLFSKMLQMYQNAPFVPNYFNSRTRPNNMKTHIKCNKMGIQSHLIPVIMNAICTTNKGKIFSIGYFLFDKTIGYFLFDKTSSLVLAFSMY